MNFYVDSGGTVIAVDPEKVYQGQAYANRIRLIGPFASTLAVTVGFTLPNGEIITPQLMTNVNGNLHEPFEDFSIWEYVIPKTITNYAGVVKVQFYVHGTRTVLVRNVETGEYEEKPQSTVIATGGSSFNVEKGVPIYPLDGEEAVDYETLLTDILGALSSLQERCKTNLENGTGENSVQQKGTTAGFANQMTVGENNANKENTLFEVGNGESEEERSNAFEVLRDGRAKVQSEPTEETDIVRLKDLSNYVTTDTTQNISASKSFVLDDGKNRRAVHILNAGIAVEVGPTGSFISSNSTTINAYGIEVQQGTVCSVNYGSTSISYVCDGNDGELLLPISQSGSYILATTDDVAMVETKTEENAETIKLHEKVLFQSGIVGVLEKSQAYTARETAEGANIVDGQTTPVLEIAGDTVKSSNLFNRNVSNKTGGATIVTNDENSIVVTANAGRTYVSANFPIENPEQYIGKTIYISAKWSVTGANKGGLRVSWLNGSAAIKSIAEGYNSEQVVSGIVSEKPENATGLYVMLYANSGGTLAEGDTATYSNVMVSLNNIAYQPYFTGLKNAFINSIKSTGRNLLPYPYVYEGGVATKTKNGVTYTIAEDGTITVNGTATSSVYINLQLRNNETTPLYNAGDYVLSGCYAGGSINTYHIYAQVEGDDTAYRDYGNGVTFNLAEKKRIGVVIVLNSGVTFTNAIFNPMLNIGKTAFEYKPYTENTYQLPQTLALGKWDKINPQTGAITRASKRIVFDGTEKWVLATNRIELAVADMHKSYKLVCNHYKNIYDATSNGCFMSAGFFVLGNGVRSNYASVEEWKAYLAELYASGNPLTIEYELATPTTETLTDIPKTYTAWKNGSETIIQGETDNSAYGAMPTITQTYFEVLGGEE